MPGPLFTGEMDDDTRPAPAVTSEWWPSRFVDETMPPGRIAPDAWLCRMPQGYFGIGIETPPKGSEFFAAKHIAQGDEVAFHRCDSFGNFLMAIAADGTWSLNRPAPLDATHWYPDEPENMWESADELAKSLFDYQGEGTYTVEPCRWTDDILYRFEIVDGVGQLVRVDASP